MSCCDICCLKHNKTTHKEVRCPHCALSSCRACTQTYLLSTREDPHCMGCKTAWTREVLDGVCTAKFRDGAYRTHRENVLFEREQQFLPEAQVEAQFQMEQQRRRDEINRQREVFFELFYARGLEFGTITHGQMQREHPDVFELYTVLVNMEIAYEEIRRENARQEHSAAAAKSFIRKCPTDQCPGFLDEQRHCGLCDSAFCRDCNERLLGGDDDEHTCDPGVVETMRLLDRDTKPCVKCGTMIQKLDGCSQMWCPQCHTAFDWRTGQIAQGRLHNPHYLDFKRQGGVVMGREHGDIPCGGAPTLAELQDVAECEDLYEHFFNRHEFERDIDWRWNPDNHWENNRRFIRVQLMLGKMSEKQFKADLYNRERRKEKRREVRDIMQTFIDTSGDQLRQYVLDPSEETLDNVCVNLDLLTDIVNDAFTDIHRRYKCGTPKLLSNR